MSDPVHCLSRYWFVDHPHLRRCAEFPFTVWLENRCLCWVRLRELLAIHILRLTILTISELLRKLPTRFGDIFQSSPFEERLSYRQKDIRRIFTTEILGVSTFDLTKYFQSLQLWSFLPPGTFCSLRSHSLLPFSLEQDTFSSGLRSVQSNLIFLYSLDMSKTQRLLQNPPEVSRRC